MRRRILRILLPVTLGVLLVACIIGSYVTVEPAPAAPSMTQNPLVDEHLLHTAHQMASLADTSAEQDLARDALRLADHELDQTFASALRDVSAPLQPPKGPMKRLVDNINELKSRIAADQERLAKLHDGDDDFDLAKAQLTLDQDELEDAQQDLTRQGGDPHAKLQQALQEHEAAEHDAVLPKMAAAGTPATFAGQLQKWIALGDRERQLQAARQDALNTAASLITGHEAMQKRMAANPGPPAEEDMKTKIERMHRLSDQTKTATEFDKRIQDTQQLADVYARWCALVSAMRRGVLNQLLRSLALILAILLAVVIVDRAIRHAFRRQKDPRRLHQLRVVSTAAVRIIGLLLILFVIFGPPSQMATVFGLVTAGLTVALKDFIVSFFGWFALMGRNGVRIGDWVEINGVGGEVIEIGFLKTVLLEMGNWTSTGHPTGRRVSFVNSFALEGHYFNFSTAGQWLWDELQVTLPLTGDPYGTAEQIRQLVERETQQNAASAESEWERVTQQYGTRTFSARPAVEIRPTLNGLNVVVRYITLAPHRGEVKSHLFELIVGLLHKPVTAGRSE